MGTGMSKIAAGGGNATVTKKTLYIIVKLLHVGMTRTKVLGPVLAWCNSCISFPLISILGTLLTLNCVCNDSAPFSRFRQLFVNQTYNHRYDKWIHPWTHCGSLLLLANCKSVVWQYHPLYSSQIISLAVSLCLSVCSRSPHEVRRVDYI